MVTVGDPFASLPEEARQRLEKRPHPDWVEPMLATLSHDHFSDPGWIFERKLDGERCLAFRHEGAVRLLSRNRKALNDSYPELEEALADQSSRDFVVDGEVVAFSGRTTSFQRLQPRMQVSDREEAARSNVAVYYYLFDLLHLAGRSTEGLALRDRKRLLKKVFHFEDPIRFTPHRNREGEAFLDVACRRGWEGLIAKDAGAPYAHSRSKRWLKFKCAASQELVIGGFTEPEGERVGLGALLLGTYEEGELRYAGKVGTGFDDDTLRRLRGRLEGRRRKTTPFTAGDTPADVHWVRPDLVAQVRFTEWTDDGRLRHPVFLGLRRDKEAEEVHRESPGGSS